MFDDSFDCHEIECSSCDGSGYDFSDGGQCEDCGGEGDVCVDDDGDFC